jgi:iron complex transport system substrate-binding protein
MNVCTDQLLIDLVPQHRIASLSYLAADRRTSGIATRIDGLHLNRGGAEEILGLNPDLVVTGEFGFRPTATVLRRLGYTVLEMPMTETLDDIEKNIAILGRALAADERAGSLIDNFRQRLNQLSYDGDGERPLFVNYDANGWTTGQTGLLADIAHRAGLSTPGDRLGFARAGQLSLETLLLISPALVDLGYAWDDPPALASELLRHPVVATVMQQARAVDIPDSAWLCGTPHTLDALAQLRRARDDLVDGSQASGT